MALPNPIYIGENAYHAPSAIRLLSYGLTTGTQGVIGTADCAVKALGTPAGSVQVMPGAYMVRAKHLGGSYEGYAGKFNVAETSAAISNTTSSGSRSDLVILRIEDPYVSGAGDWGQPADPVLGPYARIRVIEGVPSTTWDHTQLTTIGGNTWSAITLARIDRTASKGVVEQINITDLRSLATLGGTRTVVIENPPVTVPPIAQATYMEFKPSAATSNMFTSVENSWQNWPAAATWQVPVPSWATSMDIDAAVYGAQIQINPPGDIYGELRMMVNSVPQAPLVMALDLGDKAARHTLPYGGTFAVPSSIRGRVVTFRMQAKSYYNGPGRLDAKVGTTSKITINFQRVPD